jgi:hypothetical protein
LQIGKTFGIITAFSPSPYSINGKIPVGFLFLSSFKEESFTYTIFSDVPVKLATTRIV